MKDGLTNGVLRISGVYRMPKYFGAIVNLISRTTESIEGDPVVG